MSSVNSTQNPASLLYALKAESSLQPLQTVVCDVGMLGEGQLGGCRSWAGGAKGFVCARQALAN